MFDTFFFDLTQAWKEIQIFYNFLKNTYIQWEGLTVSLWGLICSAFVTISLVDVFLFWYKHHGEIDDDDYIDDL